MDELLLLDGPYIKNGDISVNDKPGVGVDLNPDVAKAHLAEGERWWG
jgi:L-alanine-DL-glutamate epimerase-like enolase superfamily enzyme